MSLIYFEFADVQYRVYKAATLVLVHVVKRSFIRASPLSKWYNLTQIATDVRLNYTCKIIIVIDTLNCANTSSTSTQGPKVENREHRGNNKIIHHHKRRHTMDDNSTHCRQKELYPVPKAN